MTSRKEIFWPVLSILPYETEADAIRMSHSAAGVQRGIVWTRL